jgi:nucleoside-diphosphate-sugar epimerase
METGFNIENDYYKKDLSIVASDGIIPWNELANKRILITGATGLICSFLVDVLMFRNENYGNNISVYALSRNIVFAKKRFRVYSKNTLFNYIQQDISENINLAARMDFIIHGASNANPAAYVADPVGTMKANILGLCHILDYAVTVQSDRVLYISSGEVYGDDNTEEFVESSSGYIDILTPRSCYPSSKRAAETLCVSYSKQYNADIVIARPCHIYGPTLTVSDNRAYAQFIRNILNNEDIVLKSDGKQIRSYCYVVDCVSGLLTILLKGKENNAYNISNKFSNVSVLQIASIMAQIGGKKVILEDPSAEEQKGYSVIKRSVLNADKLEILGWQARFKFMEGIERTIRILSEK